MTKKIFTLSYSQLHLFSTLFICSLPFIFIIIAFTTGEREILFGFVIVLGIIGVCYLFAPQHYEVDDSGLLIWRYGPKIFIPKEKILDVRPVTLKFAIRTFGTGGLFGSYGWFYASNIGKFRAYITRSDRHVLLELAGEAPLLVSPDDPDEFLKNIQEIMNERT